MYVIVRTLKMYQRCFILWLSQNKKFQPLYLIDAPKGINQSKWLFANKWVNLEWIYLYTLLTITTCYLKWITKYANNGLPKCSTQSQNIIAWNAIVYCSTSFRKALLISLDEYLRVVLFDEIWHLGCITYLVILALDEFFSVT